MLTPDEEGDMYELFQCGKARLWRNLAEETLKSIGAKLNVPFQTLGRWERGAYPSEAESRERYYRQLCEWRTEYGDITVSDER